MPQGSKSKYTSKQKRQASKIERGYKKRGKSGKEAARRAWATVNKMTGGGKKSGSGRGKKTSTASAKKGGRKGGQAKRSTSRSTAKRSTSRSTAKRSTAGKRASTGRKASSSRKGSSRKASSSRSRKR